MPGFDRTGPRGMGPMTGGGRGLCRPGGTGIRYGGFGMGFRGSSPPWPYSGRGRGGYARCWYPGFIEPAYYTALSPDQEINDLKNQAQAMKEQLNMVEERINQLTKDS